MGGACSTHGTANKVIHPFGLKKSADLEELIVDVRAALKLTLSNRV